MTAFLSWLWHVASYVYTWFSNSFSNYLNTVINVWGWIVDQANNAYNRATYWAAGEIRAVKQSISDIAIWWSGQLASVGEYARGLMAPVWGWIISYYNLAINYVIWQITTVKDWVNNTLAPALDHLRAWATIEFENRQNNILSWFNWLSGIKDRLGLLASTWTNDLLVNTIDLVNTQLANIKTFFHDPAGFILSVLWSRFIEYSCYAIAYALGTVAESLPPLPAWGHSGGPITIPDYPSPGTIPGGLARPLASLYVSGYIFGPNHPGTDFGIVDAQAVFAANSGTVGDAGWVDYGFGFTITISGDPWWTRYGHLKQVLVYSGQQVSAGQLIAYGDSTGHSTGSHLHFEIKRSGVYLDPLSVLGLGG